MCYEQIKGRQSGQPGMAPRQEQAPLMRRPFMELQENDSLQRGGSMEVPQENIPLLRSRSIDDLANRPELLQQEAPGQEWVVVEKDAKLGAQLKCRDQFTSKATDWSQGSQDMHDVQDAVKALGEVAELSYSLQNDGDVTNFLHRLDNIENKYIDAMEKCSTYIKNKDAAFFPYNKIRYAAVKNTRELLRQELDILSEIRKNMTANPEAYFNKEVSFTDLAYLFQSQKEAKDPVASLTIKDYIKVLSKAEDDAMLCKNGKLYRRTDKKAGPDAGIATRENYKMAKHLIDMILSKENIASPKTRERISKNLLYRLGVNLEEETALPVQMSVIREILLDVDARLSDMDNALFEQKKESREYQTARQIHKLLGKSLSKKSDKKALQKQVQEILKTCEKSGSWKVAKIPKSGMDYLLNGGIEAVREKAYAQALSIYQAKHRMAGEEGKEPAAMTDHEMKVLLGLTISEVVSENSVYQLLYQRMQADFAEDQILKEDKELKENLKDTRILEFGCFSASEIRLYYTHQPGKLAQMSLDDKRQGIETLCDLTEHMQGLMSLETKGIQEGLNDDEIKLLESYAATIDQMYANNKDRIDQMKQTMHPQGGMRCGIEKLQKFYQDGKSLQNSLNGKLEKLKGNPQEEKKEVEARAVVAEYKAARSIIETMPQKVQEVAAFFLKDKQPSELIKRPGNSLSKEFLRLHDVLTKMGEGGRAEVSIGGASLILSQRDSILTLEAGRKKVVLPYTADYWAKEIEGDVCGNFDSYDKNMAKQLLSNISTFDRNNRTVNRINYEKFLTSHLGISVKELTLVSASDLQFMVMIYCGVVEREADLTTEQAAMKYFNEQLAQEATKVNINSKAAMEGLVAMQKMEAQEKSRVQDKIKKDVDLGENQVAWPQEEQKILNFVGELYFSSKSGSDDNFAYTAERLKKIILANQEGFKNFCKLLKNEQEEAKFSVKLFAIEGFQAAYDAVKDMTMAIADGGQDLLSILEEDKTKDILKATADKMTEAVANISNHMQELLKESVDDLDAEDDESWKTLEDRTVGEILTQGMTGKTGEGAFNKKVLSGYISSATAADKQNMIASAFKNAPNIEAINLRGRSAMERIKGRFLSGYLKGAGPLLHKMMQGLAISTMPPMMQEAVKDVRSNLARIDDDLVDAQLHRIIKDSEGSIERIEKLKVLGTASVGQAVLIRIYEKGATHGVDKVVKILRPDASNHMERELKFMQDCAQEVDKEAYEEANKEKGLKAWKDYKGAMSRTFEGRVQNIKKEFDLRLEAKNVEIGKIYEDPKLHISTMKVDSKAKISANTLVLERAPGVSVDRFIAQQDEKRKEIFAKGDKESLYTVMTEMDSFKKEIKTKHQYLMNLTGKWLDEALFGSGFFHGDLHAGNIMMGEDGVTVIDYGNVHQLSQDEQVHILNLIASMQSMNTKRFTEHLRTMLSGDGAAIYDANKIKIEETIRTIVKKDDQASSVEKILAVLTELQKGGIDIPAGLYNFIQSFVRIAGTMTDYEALIDKANNDMVQLMDKRRRRDLEAYPDDQPMYTISRNILERYEKDYQNPDAKTLEKSTKMALDGKVANMTNVIKFFRKKAWEYMKLIGEDSQLERFHKLIYDRQTIFTHQIMGIDANVWSNPAMDIVEVKYNSRLTTEQIRNKMKTVCEKLNDALKEIEKDQKINRERMKNAKDAINKVDTSRIKLEKKVKEFELVPENENEDEKRSRLRSLNMWQGYLIGLPAQLEKYKKELPAMEKLDEMYSSWIAPTKDALKQMEEHLNAPAYNKEIALSDLENYHKSFRVHYAFNLDPNQEKEELEFLDAAAQLTSCTYRLPEEGRSDKLTDEEAKTLESPKAIKNIELSEEDKERREKDEREACRKLEAAAKKVYEKTNPKSYLEQMADILINPKKIASLENGLKDWFADTDGVELRKAYDTLKAAHEKGNVLTAESPEIVAVIQAIGKIITKRAEKLDEIMKNKSLEAQKDNDEVKKMMKGLFKEHYIKILWRLDRIGTVYFKEHALQDSEKKRLAKERKERHTAYVKQTFDSLEKSDLKNQIENLAKAAKEYKNGGVNDKQGAVQKINEAMTKIFKILTCDIAFKPQGQRLMKSLVENYEEEPCMETLTGFLTKADKYLRELFRDTKFCDPEMENQIQRPSKFENAYGDDTLDRDIILILQDMSIAKGEGKQQDLVASLKRGEQLQWVKGK